MGPKSGWGPDGYVRPVQFLDHLTVIIRVFFKGLNVVAVPRLRDVGGRERK